MGVEFGISISQCLVGSYTSIRLKNINFQDNEYNLKYKRHFMIYLNWHNQHFKPKSETCMNKQDCLKSCD